MHWGRSGYPETGRQWERTVSDRRSSILVVDDDPVSLNALRALLQADGYRVFTASEGREAIAAVGRWRPALVVLDCAMPGMTGLEVLETLRAAGEDIPVVVLSAKSDPYDKSAGYRSGADVYLGKDEDPAVLRAAIRRHMDRHATEAQRAEFPGLTVDWATWTCLVDHREVHLPPRLFRLLRALATRPGVVLRKEQLIYQVWGINSDVYNRAVDNAVVELRRLLGDESADPRFIHTVRGIGYKFEAQA